METNEYEQQAIMFPIICTHHRLHSISEIGNSFLVIYMKQLTVQSPQTTTEKYYSNDQYFRFDYDDDEEEEEEKEGENEDEDEDDGKMIYKNISFYVCWASYSNIWKQICKIFYKPRSMNHSSKCHRELPRAHCGRLFPAFQPTRLLCFLSPQTH